MTVDRAGDLEIHPDGSATWTAPVHIGAPEPLIPPAVWDAAVAEPRDILDDIDAVLAEGEPETGYDFGDPTFPRCPRGCGREWHGMAVTRRIEHMRFRGTMDPDYRYDTDDSEVLCPAPDFIGPFMPPYYARRRDINFAVSIEAEARRRTRAFIERTWAQIWELLMPGTEPVLDAARWFDPPRETEQRAPVDCSALRFVDASEFRPRLVPWQRDVLAAITSPSTVRIPREYQYPRRTWLHQQLQIVRDRLPRRGEQPSIIIIDECLPDPDPIAEAAEMAIREHDRPAVDPESAARAALDARPIRVAGARPIPREIDGFPSGQPAHARFGSNASRNRRGSHS
ncbi:hypothetical protein B7C42_01629 [Nocardia cerradoensis]|uniref:Uncharacterized protein n=1 Tax=Nocardia cerradoensis TaxID=85688 RepID=A0A231HD05_9NOCA|nr:hypothetical protein [Nocardia cerradoensis]OXR46655.1 hypothetical protein B7C42_01629 [Nocardia cerradoensis]